MADRKSLGQIHTVNFDVTGIQANDSRYLLDTAGELCGQLNHMVRHGNYFKVVGIDMTVSEFGAQIGGGSISGELRYYAPTRGRCEAFKSAFKAVREGAKLQGFRLTDNANYDFRVPLENTSVYDAPYGDLLSKATLDGTNDLALNHGTVAQSVFGMHNSTIEPRQGGVTPTFSQGFGIPGLSGTGTNFVQNAGALYDPSMHNVASTDMESIPFQVSFDPQGEGAAFTWDWQPDPALYLAVMTGQFELYVDEVDLDQDAAALRLNVAIHIAGWKSIMGNPDRKRRSRKSSKKKNGGGKK
jgi:hypothetical protein